MSKFGKKKSRRHQKIYKMKGCSKNTRKRHLGGSASNVVLAYPSNNARVAPNPFLAYNGKGGASCSTGLSPSNLAYPQNINAANPAYPNTGPLSSGFNFLNPQGNLHGGSQSGGNCGCGLGFMSGGSHRPGCSCSNCKMMKGGSGNNGIPYPNGLVGSPFNGGNINDWPGVNGIGGDRNYYPNNTYNNDVSRQMLNIGANPPFLGMKGGKKSRRKHQKGGNFSNFLTQDLINVGRQIQYGLGSAYNTLGGYPSPANPLPWKGQLPNTASLSSVKATYS